MTRILMTTDTIGGVWVYCMELINALAPYGVHFALATMGGPLNEGQRQDIDSLPNVQLHESNYRLEWMPESWSDVDECRQWLLQLSRIYHPDIIHLNNYCHGSLPWGSPVCMVGHSCVLSWWKSVLRESIPDSWQEYARRTREGLQAADRVLAPSQTMLSQLQENYGPLRNTHTIYNCRGFQAFSPSNKQPFIFTAGRLWDKAKNVALIHKVAPRLNWPVCIAGEKKYEDNDCTLDNNNYLGFLSSEEMLSWFSKASIYALPARYEPFGLSILEAGLSGCALVLGDIPSLREIWKDSAFYVHPDDEDGLFSTLQTLSVDDRLRNKMAKRALSRSRRYLPASTAEEYYQCYQGLLRQKAVAKVSN